MDHNKFVPHNWFLNPHLQTLLPRIIRRTPKFQPVWQRLELPDNDFLDLAWSEPPEVAKGKPCLVLFHGMEGNFFSPYIHGLMQAVKQLGWLSVVMHCRGCSGEPNRSKRIYYSGDTTDIGYVLQWLENYLANVPIMAAGFSLGGNMLACYLAEQQDYAKLVAAVIVSAPFMLEPCSHRLEQGFSRFYHDYLLRALKANALRKVRKYPKTLPISEERLQKIRQIREFDDLITAPIHQFHNAHEYYQRCSALFRLSKITKPLLIIHAKDDPFMAPEVIPTPAQLSPSITYQYTEYGGHVGFVGGRGLSTEMWLEQRIPQWLMYYLDKKNDYSMATD